MLIFRTDLSSFNDVFRMPQNNFGKLKPGEQKRISEAKVYRKWIARDVLKAAPLAYCWLLLDTRTIEVAIAGLLGVVRAKEKMINFSMQNIIVAPARRSRAYEGGWKNNVKNVRR
ncbi:hypothetical protein Tco_1109629 [Tanacetum coccineum]